jgi:hypothetical protein
MAPIGSLFRPQAPGSHSQILTNNFTEGLCACGLPTTLIGSRFLIVPAFPCPLSSQEFDVDIDIRKDEADGKHNCLRKHNRSSDSPTIQVFREMWAVRISPTLHHSL